MTEPTQPITRDDIENSFREVSGEITGQVKSQTNKIIPAAVGISVVFLLIAYLLGKRVGTTKSTVVEIRRI